MQLISVFDTTIADDNLGNEIIMEAVWKNLRDIFPDYFFIKVPCLDSIGEISVEYLCKSYLIFFGGTNCLTSDMKLYKQWGLTPKNYSKIRDTILMGVGWWQYQSQPTAYTRKILNSVLSHDFQHSVRDSYTAEKLLGMGFNDVLVTGCPSMWSLTQAHCKSIPIKKADNVLTTFTNYNQSKTDQEFLRMLKERYDKVFCWVQGPEDYLYARRMDPDVVILKPRLASLDNLLSSEMSIDYVGTRLHAGIRALQFKRRAIILGIDNRAIEISNDTNLPVIDRQDLLALCSKIESEFETQIELPIQQINRWKSQFDNLCRIGCHSNTGNMSVPGCSNIGRLDFSARRAKWKTIQKIKRLSNMRQTLKKYIYEARSFVKRTFSAPFRILPLLTPITNRTETSRRIVPISRVFGLDRGTAIDRYYIEKFLDHCRSDIRGNVVEIGDASYTKKFGGRAVIKSDVLHAAPNNPEATIVGDLSTDKSLPTATFDCMILTQTFQCIPDITAAVLNVHTALNDGGVLLATFPGISQISRYDMDRWGDYWRFTDASVRHLLGHVFGGENVKVETHGNVLVACSFLQGLAAEELTKEELDFHDDDYPVLITARAVKDGKR